MSTKKKECDYTCPACICDFEAPALWLTAQPPLWQKGTESIIIIEVQHGAAALVIAYHADAYERGERICKWPPNNLQTYLRNIGATRRA